MLATKVDDRYSIEQLRTHKAFEFCRNQFASKLDRTLNQSYFSGAPTNQLSGMAANNIIRIDDSEKKKMELMNQFNFVIEELIRFRNVSKFYYSNAEWLMQYFPD